MKNQIEITNQVKEIANTQYSKYKVINGRIEKLISTYGEEKISDDGFLTVGEYEFNISLCFDDISTVRNNKTLAMNLFFVETEQAYPKADLRRNFPSFSKMQKLLEDIKNPEDYGYIVISDSDIDIENDDEVGIQFRSVSEFENYVKKFDEVIDLYNDFVNEIEKFLKNLKFVIVSKTNIQEGHSNGARTQNLLFKSDKHLYKIDIRNESYNFQSFAKLLVKDESGWTCIKSFQPQSDFNIDISYSTHFKINAFERIIRELFKIADKVEEVL